jgi:Uma2 family endonuclease
VDCCPVPPGPNLCYTDGMNVAFQKPRMTREQFFAWAHRQDTRYEFDGFQPVAMTGGTLGHNRMTNNIHRTLFAALRGSGCEPFGPDAGVATIGDAVRYPDVVVTCTKTPGTSLLVENPVVIFEVVSPTSGRTDRIIKLREYGAVPSIRRYVILEYSGIGLTVFERSTPDQEWRATALAAEDILRMPEIGIEIPVTEFYENIDLTDATTQATGDQSGTE